MKVFLGGTCNESAWRNRIIPMLEIDYFNPVVDDWTEECMEREIEERESADFCLFTITPKMTGVYSIAEVVDDSNKRPERTILVLLKDDGDLHFDETQWKSLGAVAKMVKLNGGQVFDNLKSAALHMNNSDVSLMDSIKFVQHIKGHLEPGQEVMCKICNRTMRDITRQ